MKPLRVFHLTTSGDVLAGAEQLLVGMARLADRARWDLTFCTLTERSKMHEALAEFGWPVHGLDVLGFGSLPSGLHRLRAVLSAFRPDILHAHLSHATIVAAIAATLDRRLLVVQTRHYSDYVSRYHPRRRFADAWAARRCDRIIAVSEAARAQLVESERVAASRVCVVENGIEWDRVAALDHDDGRRRLAALGVPPGLRIGCAATFNVRKGHTYLLQAMVRVRAHYPQAHLVLLGTGADEAAIRTEARALGLADQVHFLGHRQDGQALMAGLDVYVQPSIEEGFGLALVEAMAMRLPVVATAVGGMMKTVEPDRTGLRVPPADPAALAEAIGALLDDRARAATLGEQASAHVRKHYSIQRMMAQYDEVYRAALEAAP